MRRPGEDGTAESVGVSLWKGREIEVGLVIVLKIHVVFNSSLAVIILLG